MLTETRPILATMARRPRAHQGTTKKDQSLDQGRGSEVTGSSSNNPPKPSRSPSTLPRIRRIHLAPKTGNIFDTWDNGIARAIKKQYPNAYAIHHAHCYRSLPMHLVGTALLIAPRANDARQHYIGCLFVTSKGHARSRRDKPKHHEITQATGLAMTDLLRQVVRDGTVGEMRMCRILSRYGVPWQNTRWTIGSLELTEEEVIGRRRGVTITVYSPA